MRLDRDFEPGSLTWPSILETGWMTSCSSVFASVHSCFGQHRALKLSCFGPCIMVKKHSCWE